MEQDGAQIEHERSTPKPAWFVAWHFPEDRIYTVDGKTAEQWMLEFVGQFSGLQSRAECAVGDYLAMSCPSLGTAIGRKHLRRVADEERWDYFKALAKDVGYQGKLIPAASESFSRCKSVRDFVSHQTRLSLVRLWGSASYYYDVPEKWRRAQMPDPLTPETFRGLSVECQWLHALIDHVAYLGGSRFISAAARVDERGAPVPQYLKVVEPPPMPLPKGWDRHALHKPIEDE